MESRANSFGYHLRMKGCVGHPVLTAYELYVWRPMEGQIRLTRTPIKENIKGRRVFNPLLLGPSFI